MKRTIRNIFLATISGVFGVLAFPPFGYSFLGWIALTPLIFAAKGASGRDSFLYGYLAGAVFFSGVLYWLPNVTVPGAIVLVLVLAAFYGLFAVVASIVTKYSMDVLLLSFVWVVLEFIRSNLFTGFPWALLGASQYKMLNIIQIADITGVYGVSFLMAAFGAALFALLDRSERKISYMMVALLFVLVSSMYGNYRMSPGKYPADMKISVVQGNIPQRFKWDADVAEEIVAEYTRLTEKAAEEGPDLVIWPETSFPFLVPGGAGAPGAVTELVSETGVPLLAGIIYRDNGTVYNAAALFEEDGMQIYRKNHLVPFGEYIPFEDMLGSFRGLIDKPIGDFGRGNGFSLFDISTTRTFVDGSNTVSRQTSFFKFGVMICFEDVFPYIAREFCASGADLLVNITNDAWFGRTAAAEQHLISSVFRAVENRVPVVRAANTGISGFIDPIGEVYSRVYREGKDIFVEGYDTENIYIYPGGSLYTLYGDIFVYFCAVMMLLIITLEALRLRRK
ncbi:MAG: apolipoprotein N-acyltransferase [Candidatus Omnitrophica bacterium]|nr:apolipoprotein N-acyltransferase [Candidatus Omnitrophota bacterium]